jgi:hypothetical protein
VIIARQAFSVFCRAWGLWEADMAEVFNKWLVEKFRAASNRCILCGTDLPYPVDSSGLCPKCIAEGVELVASPPLTGADGEGEGRE